MLFMVIEHFRPGQLPAVAERFQSKGRMLPEGVEYVDSWMEKSGDRCFQIMKATDRETLDVWVSRWSDIVDFDVTKIQTSSEFWANRS